MCGIFGYVGHKNASKKVIEGLRRLEYRGYDSWGVAIVERGTIRVQKDVGAIGDNGDKISLPRSYIGVGHTRWATHGGVTEINAHPHFSSDRSFVLAQNGIVENFQPLKASLKRKGARFSTETDTEIIVRLIEEKLKSKDTLAEAIRSAFLELQGRNTIIVLSAEGDQIVCIRNGSPLVIGIGKDETYFASDTLSFADKTSDVVFIDNMEIVEYKEGKIKVSSVMTGNAVPFQISKLDNKNVEIAKEGFDHFMLKEIVEQQHTIREAVQYSEKDLAPLLNAIRKANTVYTVGAGTASFAAGQIAYFIRKHAGIKTLELKAYELDSYSQLFSNRDLIIAVSQSGETADTIEALEQAKAKGVKIASIVNMIGSTVTRMSELPFFSRSGPEICVASTKAFTAQCAWGLLVALSLRGDYKKAKSMFKQLTGQLKDFFNETSFDEVKRIAERLSDREHFFVLGKGQNYYIALEGALKIKEITYKHFEGFAAGELKHGVIALIEKGTPVFVIVSEDEDKKYMLGTAAEVKARGAWTIGVASRDNDLFDDFIPDIDAGVADSLVNVIPFQLLSYYLGVELGNSPDRPRNLAKSVTVR